MSKKYIHPDIISKEELKEQPESHREALLYEQHWRITENRGGNAIELAELFMSRCGKTCECVLVEGGPGMGKSTLAWQVCHRWGKRELFNQYVIVLLLMLRDKRVQQAEQIEDLFFFVKHKKTQVEVIREISDGRAILVILDGLDELPGHLLSEQSIFTDLLSGEVLGNATVLVTSRPSATTQLLMCWQQRITKHYVICGFNKDDIEEYTKSILSCEQILKFQKQLFIHPHIQSIMYVPLHTAIVMAVFLQYKQLPKTLTQLYSWLVKTILSQYLADLQNLRTYQECNETCDILGLKLPRTVHTQFIDLCKFCYENVCDQRLIFHDMPIELHNLGFTDSVSEIFLPGSCSYNFLHLSVQEFLAAYHVSLMSSQNQEKLLLRSHEYYFRNMMVFVAGITKFEGYQKEAVKQVVKLNDEGVCHLDDYSLELLYESQNVSIMDVECNYTFDQLYAQTHHYLALGYCIANSKSIWRLELNFSVSTMEVLMLVLGLQDCETQPTYTIKSINWKGYDDETCGKLFAQAPEYFTTHTETLHLQHFSTHNLTLFCQWLPTCQLKTLSLHCLLPHNITIVSRVLTEVPTLKILNIRGSTFTLQGMQAFASMLQHNQSLTEIDVSSCTIDSDFYTSNCISYLTRALHTNTTLRVLNISDVSMGEEETLAMAVMLKFNRALKKLNICENSVGERGALAIAEMLKYNTTLKVLDMRFNSICERGALAMAESLEQNTTLSVLNMSGNSVGWGAIALLKYNTTLTELYISHNQISEEGCQEMAEVLKHNATLTVLDISMNSLGFEGALAMAEMLKHNKTLEVLDMSGNSVGEWGAVVLAEMLKYNTNLTELHMSQNIICVEGVRAMAEMLTHNTTLMELDISKNLVGIEGALIMAEMLKHNTTLRELNMSVNSVGDMGAIAMAEVLYYNTSLTVLNMSENSIEVNRALAMGEMLNHNTSLEKLHMHDTTIGDEGAIILVMSLAMNHHLKKLYISYKYWKEVEALPIYHINKERVIQGICNT